MSVDFQVDLDLFHGPLDLLLYLVRRNELDALEVAVARVTEQFVEFLDVLESIDLDLVGEFLVTAGALIEIKSRLALPQPETEDEPDLNEEPRGELVRHLLEYRKFRNAATALEERAAQWQQRYPRLSDDRPRQSKDLSADHIKEVELWDLVSALSRILKKQTVAGNVKIRYDETPVSVDIERIRDRVKREGRVPFSGLFETTSRRSRIVGIFLAVLELLRHHGFRAQQPEAFGEIWILPPSADSTADASAVNPAV